MVKTKRSFYRNHKKCILLGLLVLGCIVVMGSIPQPNIVCDKLTNVVEAYFNGNITIGDAVGDILNLKAGTHNYENPTTINYDAAVQIDNTGFITTYSGGAQDMSGSLSVSVPAPTAGGHALNQDAGDGRFGQLVDTNTWTKANTFNDDVIVTDADADTEAMNRRSTDARYFRVLAKQTTVTSDMAGDTNEQTIYTYNVPANTLGTTGFIRIFAHWETPDSSGVTFRMYYGGTGGFKFFEFSQTCLDCVQTHFFYTAGTTNLQRSYDIDYIHFGAGSLVVHPTGSVDSTANQDIVLTAQLSDASDVATHLLMVLIEFAE